ncbi:MAG: GNAT family N-acetyltransferase [Halieaceae bacterium]|nr:GNAT family N-acetyltransferase [Halieaceae bacterium]
MAADTCAAEVRFLTSLAEVDAQAWDRVAGEDYPFLRHAFLLALEETGCTDADSGWQPYHVTLHRDGKLVALMPMYLKSHSYGEYVFDWSWADAYHRNGREYYPKLLTAIPFTPATGPRLCWAEGEEAGECVARLAGAVKQLARQRGLSSWHVLFPDDAMAGQLASVGACLRQGSQFHWFNEGFATFDDFLDTFNSRKRKSLKRERRRVQEQGITLEILEGNAITAAHWAEFYRFYQMTYAKRSGHGGYLTRAFFQRLGEQFSEHCVLVRASIDGEAVAGSLCFRSSDTLYGRYWGCVQELDCLHFEACYYQGIEYCIRNGLKRFDPGAQGEHKIQRGFTPIPTVSAHWIAEPMFAEAIADFTQREREHVDAYIEEASTLLPFKSKDA